MASSPRPRNGNTARIRILVYGGLGLVGMLLLASIALNALGDRAASHKALEKIPVPTWESL